MNTGGFQALTVRVSRPVKMIKTFSQVTTVGHDNMDHQMWTATSELKSKRKELNDGSPGKSEAIINQDISKEITKAVVDV
jgi:hypothetical protein